MIDDPIVAEVRQQRAAILNAFDGDFEKMSKDAMKRQWETGRKVVSRKQRKLEQGTAGNAYSLRNVPAE